VQSLVGWQVGLGTAFRGITKLAPGSLATLHAGRVGVERYLAETTAPETVPSVADVVDEMAQILRDLHTAYLTDHPDTVLQLTGGQDSRLLLCAVPPGMRAGMHALTLDTHGGVESTIAGRLSAEFGLDHQVYWLDEQPPIEPAAGYRMAIEATVALDCMASPLALAPLARVESTLDQGHRLSGAGGETARGFYYPGQPRRATTSRQLVSRLADWRLFTNEAVDTEAVEADFAAGARRDAIEAVHACFAAYPSDWLRATDEFYLWQRTQRWAGAHGTPASVDRFFINPLLDRRFMQLALAPAPEEKRNSYLTGRLMHRLDPRLAAIPLDSGLVPARLGRRGPATTAAVARVTARKAIAKVRQRIGGGRRAQRGAAELASLVIEHWRAVPDTTAPLRRTGLIRPSWLDELLEGRRGAGPATVAFMVNLLVATEAVTPTPVSPTSVSPTPVSAAPADASWPGRDRDLSAFG
jgi:asparagine synthase (glutamine-hydrolysing)